MPTARESKNLNCFQSLILSLQIDAGVVFSLVSNFIRLVKFWIFHSQFEMVIWLWIRSELWSFSASGKILTMNSKKLQSIANNRGTIIMSKFLVTKEFVGAKLKSLFSQRSLTILNFILLIFLKIYALKEILSKFVVQHLFPVASSSQLLQNLESEREIPA